MYFLKLKLQLKFSKKSFFFIKRLNLGQLVSNFLFQFWKIKTKSCSLKDSQFAIEKARIFISSKAVA